MRAGSQRHAGPLGFCEDAAGWGLPPRDGHRGRQGMGPEVQVPSWKPLQQPRGHRAWGSACDHPGPWGQRGRSAAWGPPEDHMAAWGAHPGLTAVLSCWRKVGSLAPLSPGGSAATAGTPERWRTHYKRRKDHRSTTESLPSLSPVPSVPSAQCPPSPQPSALRFLSPVPSLPGSATLVLPPRLRPHSGHCAGAQGGARHRDTPVWDGICL